MKYELTQSSTVYRVHQIKLNRIRKGFLDKYIILHERKFGRTSAAT